MAGGMNSMRRKLLKELKELLTRFVSSVQSETMGMMAPIAALSLIPYLPSLEPHAALFAEQIAAEFGDLILRIVQTGLQGRVILSMSQQEDRLTSSVLGHLEQWRLNPNTAKGNRKAVYWRKWSAMVRNPNAFEWQKNYYPDWDLFTRPPQGLPPATVEYILSFDGFIPLAADVETLGAWPGLITEILADIVVPTIPTTTPTPDPGSLPADVPVVVQPTPLPAVVPTVALAPPVQTTPALPLPTSPVAALVAPTTQAPLSVALPASGAAAVPTNLWVPAAVAGAVLFLVLSRS